MGPGLRFVSIYKVSTHLFFSCQPESRLIVSGFYVYSFRHAATQNAEGQAAVGDDPRQSDQGTKAPGHRKGRARGLARIDVVAETWVERLGLILSRLLKGSPPRRTSPVCWLGGQGRRLRVIAPRVGELRTLGLEFFSLGSPGAALTGYGLGLHNAQCRRSLLTAASDGPGAPTANRDSGKTECESVKFACE